MSRRKASAVLLGLLGLRLLATAEPSSPERPLSGVLHEHQVHTGYTDQDGLPPGGIMRIFCDRDGIPHVLAADRFFVLRGERWVEELRPPTGFDHPLEKDVSVRSALHRTGPIRQVARRGSEIVVAGENGLFRREGADWELLMPRQGVVRWAPLDIRAVAYDPSGHLWFACPQGAGRRIGRGEWELFTGAEGLPFNEFTCIAAGLKGVWFGTTNGALRYARNDWEFRHGKRWLVDNHINEIAIAKDGTTWMATGGGVSRIRFRPMSLQEKAVFYEEEIERYHLRTELGYVGPAHLAVVGDKRSAVAQASDNDGFFNGLYLGAMSLAYAVTGKPEYQRRAARTFRALAFLSEVTQGGSNPGPPGLIARTVLPTDGPNPNRQDSPERDRRIRSEEDELWKVIDPRWPIDRTGNWYWKCDASADEVDGHFFGYAIYFDRVCETHEEKERVRRVVRRISDHLLAHDFRLIDHDGKATRWSRLSPQELNRNAENWEERGLNSWSLLTYLLIAHHITGDAKYRTAYEDLARNRGFAMNGMTQPQVTSGPGSFHQGDDDMSFLNYYHLLRYERDETLLNVYRLGAFYHWRIEQYERNPFFNFVYAACCLGESRRDHWGVMDLSPPGSWLADSVDALVRWPLDLIDWPMSNAHRIDRVPLPGHAREPGKAVGKGHRVGGYVFARDERGSTYLEDDVWQLSVDADGTQLRPATAYLLAYYLGRAHGFLSEEEAPIASRSMRDR